MSEPVFDVAGLVHRYGRKSVLEGLDFQLHEGECLVILGRSGVGKSVTLRLLIGLEPPVSGSIQFRGQELVGLSERELLPIRRRVAMLFQGGALFDSMTVFENLAFPIREHKVSEIGALPETVRELLEKVGLPGIEERVPADLSGGMKKRVALARALALEPEVLLFDEPTTGLDPMTAASIGHLILDTRTETGCSMLVVTHDLALTRRVADRIALIDRGVMRFIGTVEEAERSDDRMLGDFLAGREESDVA